MTGETVSSLLHVRTMTFTTLVKILYGHSVGYDKKKAAFAVDFLRRSGGKHFVSDPAANPDTDTLRRSDLEGVKQLLKKEGSQRPLEGSYADADFDFSSSASFLMDHLNQDRTKVAELAGELGISDQQPRLDNVAKAVAAFLGKMLEHGESSMPPSVTIDSLYHEVLANPDAFSAQPASAAELSLIVEASNKCPLCKGRRELLYRPLNGKVVRCFQIVDIFDADMGEDDVRKPYYDSLPWKPAAGTSENRIVLCQTHASIYAQTKSTELPICEKVYAAKSHYRSVAAGESASESHNLGPKIHELLDHLVAHGIRHAGHVDLSVVPVTLETKLDDCDTFLFNDVFFDVASYFNDIQDYLGDWEKKGFSPSTQLAYSIRDISNELLARSLTQEQIIREITRIVDDETGHKSEMASRAIVSFFIQHCEVLSR